MADADEVVVAPVVGEQRDDHAGTRGARRRRSARRPGRRCRAARPRRRPSRPCSRAVALRDRADRHDPRARRRPRAGLEQEAHGRAGGEGHVGRPARAPASCGVAERLGDGVVERRRRRPRRRARAARRAARRAPRPRARRARAGPRPRRAPSASTSASATKRSGTTSGADAVRERAPRRCRARWRRRCAAGERARVASARAASASKNRRTPFGLVKQTSAYSPIRSIASRSSPSTGRGSIRIAGVSTTSAPSSRSRAGQAARLRAGARDGDHLAVERPPLEPRDRLAQLGDRADERDRRRPDLLGLRPARRCPPSVSTTVRWPGMGAALDHRGRLARVAPGRDQPLRDQRQVLDPHVEDERAGEARERVPVERGLRLLRVLVAGDERDRRRGVAVRDRDARVGGRRHAGRHAGHDLERHARRGQRLRLLAAAPEHERVAALQPHDAPAGAAELDEQRVDLLLRQRGRARLLARRSAAPRPAARRRARPAGSAGRRGSRRPRRSARATRRVISPGSPGPAPTR